MFLHPNRNFSDDHPVDCVETEKSRIILHELETGWWILASIHYTRLPPTRVSNTKEPRYEYSSREVSPPQLLLQQLIRAQSTFLLHHAASLSDLYVRLPREQFSTLLDRFWSQFIWNWDVLLHGNPPVDIFNGTKLSAGGELGIGVGEEEWGSGEREVLEDFVSRTDGLVDLVVSRFGDAPPQEQQEQAKIPGRQRHQETWLGSGADPRPSDGVLFSGVGAMSKRSLATVSQWMEWIYRYGSDAYGVGENPSSTTQRKRRRRAAKDPAGMSTGRRDSMRRTAIENRTLSPGIPPPIVRAVDKSLENATTRAEEKPEQSTSNEDDSSDTTKETLSISGADTMMKVLTLGYGSTWKLPKGFHVRGKSYMTDQAHDQNSDETPDSSTQPKEGLPEEQDDGPLKEVDPTPEVSDDETQSYKQILEESIGKFVIGLTADLENETQSDVDETNGVKDDSAKEAQRILVRTLIIEMAKKSASSNTLDSPETDFVDESPSRYQKLQVIVYVHQPFIFTFLFTLHTSSLSYPSFYRSIHHQLGPLQKPLLNSTDPSNVALRIESAMGVSHYSTAASQRNGSKTSPPPSQSIHDLVYDPVKLTVHTSIANIPEPGTLAAEGLQPASSSGSWLTLGIPTGPSSTPHKPSSSSTSTSSQSTPWTRITALNVHTQILNTYIATRALPNEVERTSKTSRGWWVLWMRIPHQNKLQQSTHANTGDNEGQTPAPREAFLIRQATDSPSAGASVSTGSASSSSGSRKISASTAMGKGWLYARDGGVGVERGTSTSGATAGVSEGIGVDARRWIEGLLALNR